MTNKELKSLIKLLRAQGVMKYTTPELSLILREKVSPQPSRELTTTSKVPTEGTLTLDQLIDWNNVQVPEEQQ